MKLEGICVLGYARDLFYTQCCVASIREFHPEIPVYLLKDLAYGPYDTTELERALDVRPWEATRRLHGLGWARLDVLFSRPARRLLILDSDTVLIGPVVRELEAFDEDFVSSMKRTRPRTCATRFTIPRG